MLSDDGPSGLFRNDWGRLWDLAESVAAGNGGSPSTAFDPVGLLLENPKRPSAWCYDATPSDSVTFASTGGDGVHFSAKRQGTTLLVLMTVPMQWEEPNYVLGTSLLEFLGLGCWTGYFDLEQLAYDRMGFLERLNDGSPNSTEEAEQLQLLRDRFELRRWTDVEQRLQQLGSLLGP